MVEVTPLFAVFGPLLFIAFLRERYAFYLFLVSIPLFTVVLFQAISHPFRLPELTLMVLSYHYIKEWLRNGKVVLPNRSATLWFLAFAAVCGASVLYAVMLPPTDILGHPYDMPYRPIIAKPLFVSFTNITQLLLRLVFIGGVFIVAASMTKWRLRLSLRWIVFSAVVTGAIGMAYQILIATNIYNPFAMLHSLGIDSFPVEPGSLVTIPRMNSFPGEPGYTADFLLYGLAIATMCVLLRGKNGILRRSEAWGCLIVLAVFLVLSTSSTGYGGLVVLCGVIAISLLMFKNKYRSRILKRSALVGFALVIAGLLVPTVRDVILYQFSKFKFEAGSGSIRLHYIGISLDIWQVRPLLGVGVGSHSIPSSTFTVLAETGIIGLGVLVTAYTAVFLQPLQSIGRKRDQQQVNLLLIVLVSSVTLVLTNAIAKSMITFLFPWYWMALGCAMAAPALLTESTNSPSVKAGSANEAKNT